MTILDLIKSGFTFNRWSIEKLPDNYLQDKNLAWLEKDVEELRKLEGEYGIFIEQYYQNGLFSGTVLFAMNESGEILYSKLVIIS